MDSKKQENLQEARVYNIALEVTTLQQWCLNAKPFNHKNIMFIIVHSSKHEIIDLNVVSLTFLQ
jgi:hypothetical protein